METWRADVDTRSLFSYQDVLNIRILYANKLYFYVKNQVDLSLVTEFYALVNVCYVAFSGIFFHSFFFHEQVQADCSFLLTLFLVCCFYSQGWIWSLSQPRWNKFVTFREEIQVCDFWEMFSSGALLADGDELIFSVFFFLPFGWHLFILEQFLVSSFCLREGWARMTVSVACLSRCHTNIFSLPVFFEN